MTDKEIKRLRRAELIEIIYEFQKNQDILQTQVNNLRAALSERQIKIRESGSIAEAALRINEVFEKAQAAADQYLDSIKVQDSNHTQGKLNRLDSFEIEDSSVKPVPAEQSSPTEAASIERDALAKAEQIKQDAQNYADSIVNDARKQADSIIRKAKAQQGKIVASTEAAVSEKWAEFRNDVETALKASPGADGKAIMDYLLEMRSDDAQ